MLENPSVAIVGATGAVGTTMIECLEARRFPLSRLRLLASARSEGKRLPFRGRTLPIEVLGESSFAGVDIALFSAGNGIARHFAPAAVRAGATVIDNSSAFRQDPDIPLVVPEINGAEIARHGGIIANPNCVAIVAAMALWPIHRRHRIERVTLASYQAASGGGAAAMEELRRATKAHLAGDSYPPTVLPHPYAFNLFSHNTPIDPVTGYNGEETKVMRETRRLLGAAELRIGATCIRVPVLRAHAIAMTVDCAEPITPEAVRALLADAPGIRLVDDWERNHFPMPSEASGQGDVLVGRIRSDAGDPTGRSIALFAAGDQLLKGAALNAVQIAEALLGGPSAIGLGRGLC